MSVELYKIKNNLNKESDQSQLSSGHMTKPQSNNFFFGFSFLTPYWLFPCNVITFHKNISSVHGFVSFTASCNYVPFLI